MLHRLAEAKVGGQRHRYQQVGKPYARIGHGRSIADKPYGVNASGAAARNRLNVERDSKNSHDNHRTEKPCTST